MGDKVFKGRVAFCVIVIISICILLLKSAILLMCLNIHKAGLNLNVYALLCVP